jgi:hypothetical protein
MEKWTVADIPSQAGTLQTSGPGRPQNYIEKIVASFMSQDAAQSLLDDSRRLPFDTDPLRGRGRSRHAPPGLSCMIG